MCRHNWNQKIKVHSFFPVFSKEVVLHRLHLTDTELNSSFSSIAEQLRCTNRHRKDFSLCEIFLQFREHNPVQKGQNSGLRPTKLVDCTDQTLKQLCSFISIETTQNCKRLQSVVHYCSFLTPSFCKVALKEDLAFEGFSCVGTMLHQALAWILFKALRIDSRPKSHASTGQRVHQAAWRHFL